MSADDMMMKGSQPTEGRGATTWAVKQTNVSSGEAE